MTYHPGQEFFLKALNEARKHGFSTPPEDENDGDIVYVSPSSQALFLSNPAFWQALGKARPNIGIEDMWKDTPCDCGGVDFHISGHDAHHIHCKRVKAPRGWKYTAMEFFKHQMDGKDIESFFQNL